MSVAILADFTSNDKYTDLAKKTLKNLTGLQIDPMCLRNTSYSAVKKANTIIQFLPPEKLIRFPYKTNVAVGTYEELGQFAEIVDHVWDDYPILVELNNNTINIPHLNGEYVFYTINENYDKSNTRMIIQAFTEEFDPAEPVNLVIKTNRTIDKEMVDIKTSIGKFKDINLYKKNVVISKNYTEEDICAIHNSFDCYVSSEDNNNTHMEYTKMLNKPTITDFDIYDMKNDMREYYIDRVKSDNFYYTPLSISDYFFEKLGELNGEIEEE